MNISFVELSMSVGNTPAQPPPYACFLSFYWQHASPAPSLCLFLVFLLATRRPSPLLMPVSCLSVGNTPAQPPPYVCFLPFCWQHAGPAPSLCLFLTFLLVTRRPSPLLMSVSYLSVGKTPAQPPPYVCFLSFCWQHAGPAPSLCLFLVFLLATRQPSPLLMPVSCLSVGNTPAQPPPYACFLSFCWQHAGPAPSLCLFLAFLLATRRPSPLLMPVSYLSVGNTPAQPPPYVCFLSFCWQNAGPAPSLCLFLVFLLATRRPSPLLMSVSCLSVGNTPAQPPPYVCFLSFCWQHAGPAPFLCLFLVFLLATRRPSPLLMSVSCLSVGNTPAQPPPYACFLPFCWQHASPAPSLCLFLVFLLATRRPSTLLMPVSYLSVGNTPAQPPPYACFLSFCWQHAGPAPSLCLFLVFLLATRRPSPLLMPVSCLYVGNTPAQPPPYACFLSFCWQYACPAPSLCLFLVFLLATRLPSPLLMSVSCLSVGNTPAQPPPYVCFLPFCWQHAGPAPSLCLFLVFLLATRLPSPLLMSVSCLSVGNTPAQPPPYVCFLSFCWQHAGPAPSLCLFLVFLLATRLPSPLLMSVSCLSVGNTPAQPPPYVCFLPFCWQHAGPAPSLCLFLVFLLATRRPSPLLMPVSCLSVGNTPAQPPPYACFLSFCWQHACPAPSLCLFLVFLLATRQPSPLLMPVSCLSVGNTPAQPPPYVCFLSFCWQHAGPAPSLCLFLVFLLATRRPSPLLMPVSCLSVGNTPAQPPPYACFLSFCWQHAGPAPSLCLFLAFLLATRRPSPLLMPVSYLSVGNTPAQPPPYACFLSFCWQHAGPAPSLCLFLTFLLATRRPSPLLMSVSYLSVGNTPAQPPPYACFLPFCWQHAGPAPSLCLFLVFLLATRRPSPLLMPVSYLSVGNTPAQPPPYACFLSFC